MPFKTMQVAKREFTATVLTRTFLIAVFIVPVIFTVSIFVAPLLMSNKAPAVKGTVGIIDRSGGDHGLVADALAAALTPASIEARHKAEAKEVTEAVATEMTNRLGKAKGEQARQAMAFVADDEAAPNLTPEVLPPATDVEQEKLTLRGTSTVDGSRLALVVIGENAVSRAAADQPFGSYEIYVKSKLDSRAQRAITDQVGRTIVRTRLAAAGSNPDSVLAMTITPRPQVRAVTPTGDKSTGELQQMLVPAAFIMLLWISVFTSGQFLMTSTIEEKSNRIMEVLLSAVSPLQLMTGKIIGQMGAGLLILSIYSGVSIASLIYFNRTELLDYGNLIYLIGFFFIAFFTIASMMAAVGSVVTDIHEAQALLMPIMIVIAMPMILMMPIISNPSGRLATTLSFLPPFSPFVMVLRMSSVSQPPPQWQVLLALGLGVATVFVALRVAAKIFRIGVLLYGKPPNFGTLLKWVRMA